MRLLRYMSVFAALAWAAACSESAPPAAAPSAAPKVAAAKADAGTTVTDAAPLPEYRYDPTAKRDPFRSPVEEVTATAQNGSCNDPLCQFDIEQLSLVAVVTGDSSPIAMVEDSMHRGYIVRPGSKMGKQAGKVTQILRDSVIVTEYWTGPDGKVKPNPVALKLTPEKTTQLDMDLLQGKPYAP